MDSLLFQINKQADDALIENEIISANLDLLVDYLSIPDDQLNEAISTWLAKVRNEVASGRLKETEPETVKIKQGIIRALGALSAISNPDLADALDDEGNLGRILFDAGGSDEDASKAALQKLALIGGHPSVKTFVANVAADIDNAQAIDSLTKKIQAKIEPIMNKKRSLEARSKTF